MLYALVLIFHHRFIESSTKAADSFLLFFTVPNTGFLYDVSVHDPLLAGVVKLVVEPLVLQQAVPVVVEEQGFATPEITFFSFDRDLNDEQQENLPVKL